MSEITLESLGLTISLKPRPAKPGPKPKSRTEAIAAAARTPRPSPWFLEAIEYPLQEIQCRHCGASTIIAASDTPMALFRHKRNQSSWAVAYHPSQFAPTVPKRHKMLEPIKRDFCIECVEIQTSESQAND